MPNTIKYNTSSESNALSIGNMHMGVGDVGKGPTESTGFYNGINPPNGGYTIYIHKTTGGPSILRPISDAELIDITNGIAEESYTTINECFNYFAGQDDKTVMHNPINYLVTDGLVFYVNAGVIPSYPHNNNTWYDLSGESNNTTISSADYNSGGGYFQSVGDAPDSLIFATPDSTTISDTFSVVDGGWTIEELIRIDDTTYPEAAAGTVVSSKAYGSNETGFDWNHGLMSGTSLNIDMSNKNTGGGATRDAEVNLAIDSDLQTYGQWILRSIYWDRTNDKCGVYYNGRFQDSGSISGVSGFPLYDGGGISWGTLYGWHHEGARSFMRVYNKVLSESEVKQNYYQAPIVTDGLVFAADPGNLVSYESGSTTAYSLTGSISGTLNNGVGFDGSNGGVFEFDGVDDGIKFETGMNFSGNSAITITGWLYVTGGGSWDRWFSGATGTYYHHPDLAILANGDIGFYFSNLNTSWIDTNQSIGLNTWALVSYVFKNDGNVKIYIDDEIVYNNTFSSGTFPTDYNFMLGNRYDYNGEAIVGKIGPVSIYNRQLTAEEISQNYKANVNRFN